MEQLTQQEEEVMRIVWSIGEGTIKEYHEESDEPRVPYTTFASIVGNLERKGFVTVRRIGITKYCTPAVEEELYKRKFLKGFVNHYFKNSYKEVVSFFAKNENISTEELKEIIQLIEKGKH